MGNRIIRTVLFAASALLSISAFGAGAARFGTLRNPDWVVTNAWQAVSNKTHDLIIDMGQESSLPPNWTSVSNAAMNAVQSLSPSTNYTDAVAREFTIGERIAGYAEYSAASSAIDGDEGLLYQNELIKRMTNAAIVVANEKISTNNAAFVSAVLAAPLVGANPSDLSEIAEYGSYGTVGAALLALIAGFAALKRGKMDGAAAYPAWVQGDDYEPPDIVSHKGRLWSCQNYTIAEPGEEPRSDWVEVTIENLKQNALTDAQMDAANSGVTAEKVAAWDGYAVQIAQKASFSDLPYRLVTPGEWEFGELPSGVTTVEEPFYDAESSFAWGLSVNGDVPIWCEAPEDALSLDWEYGGGFISATRASLPGHLCDRAGNRVVVTGDTTLTLPAANPGYLRDFLVRLEISGSTVPTITFAAPTGETITYETDGDEFPVPDAEGTWLYSFTETAAHRFAVSLKKVNEVTQGGS